MTSITFETTLQHNGSMCCIPIEFDPKPLFGKVRAPVVVTLKGYRYRSTIAAMHGSYFIPLRKSHLEAAGLDGTEHLEVTLSLDPALRKIELSDTLASLLRASPARWQAWLDLSYSHQREHVEAIEQARKPETRQRRIDALLKRLDSA